VIVRIVLFASKIHNDETFMKKCIAFVELWFSFLTHRYINHHDDDDDDDDNDGDADADNHY
jgi:hypothetical protein